MMQFGYYGKTVQRGDFVRFNLPQVFINVWDDWLQTTLAEGENQHGENWSGIYGNSNAYRFGLSEGIAGESAWIGVMRPTTDKVGRRFPFCLALALPPNISPIAHAVPLDPVYTAIQQLMDQVIQPDYNFDSLQESMGELSLNLELGISGDQVAEFKPTDPTTALAIRANSASVLATHSSTAALLDAVLQQTWYSFSIWRAIDHGGENDHSSILACGLPLGSSALALFDGAWQARDCGRLQLPKVEPEVASGLDQTAPAPSAISLAAAALLSDQPDPVEEASNADAPADDDLVDLTPADTPESIEVANDDLDFEFQATEKILPAAELASDIPEPTVEKLELDEELVDHEPWDDT